MNTAYAPKNVSLLNSILPLNAKTSTNSSMFSPKNAGNSSSLSSYIGIIVFLVVLAVAISLMIVYGKEVTDAWNNAVTTVNTYFNGTAATATATATATEPVPVPVADTPVHSEGRSLESQVLEKIMPGGAEVFNVSANKYTSYDAEPLCKALGAELATYQQVKDAWSKGADWCNYGWVKGQMAVYPTSDTTWNKLQTGPEDQRMSCGIPGVNGGYFDNPELKFGVTCFGQKPAKTNHDDSHVAKGAPVSPDAILYNKKVSQFKSEADNIAILPFNSNTW